MVTKTTINTSYILNIYKKQGFSMQIMQILADNSFLPYFISSMTINITIKQTILAVALFIGVGAFLVSPVVSAAKCGNVELKTGQSCCGGAVTSVISCNELGGADVKDSGVWSLLLLTINILTAGIGVAAVGGILYGSIMYASAGGSAEQVKKAKGIIANVVIGIVAYALMYAFLNFLIPGGLFQ